MLSEKTYTNLLYVARLVSAFCLFYLLGVANVWVDATSNTLLVLGYRLFILFASFFIVFGLHNIGPLAFFVSLLGLVGWFFGQYILGSFLIALGMAVGGYAIKYFTVKTPQGAAITSISINLGIFFSGLAVSFGHFSQKTALVFLSLFIIITIGLSFATRNIAKTNQDAMTHQNFSLRTLLTQKGAAWALVGLSVGIEVISIFSILPQYLIHKLGSLPTWYGLSCMSVNAATVILLQSPIMRMMEKLSLGKILGLLLIGMVVITMPGVFYIEYWFGAAFLTFILSIIECTTVSLDTFSVREGALLAKDACFGIGSALVVFLMRSPLYNAPLIIGSIGILTLIIACILLKKELKTKL